MAERALSDNPQWFDKGIPNENREAAIELDFERLLGNDKDYLNADAATQQEYRAAHRQLIEEAALKSKHNPLNQQRIEDQKAADRNGFIANLLDTGRRSLASTADRITMVDDLTGKPDQHYATQVATYLQKQSAAPMTRERMQLAQDMKLWDERTDKSGFLGDVAATAELFINNPAGILDVAAESIGSMASMAAGAKAGSAAAAGLTAATGGWAAPAAPFITGAGMFTAEAADAASAKMVEKIQTVLDDKGLAYTPDNVQMLLDKHPDLIEQVQKDSLVYGGVLGAVDVALGGFFSKMASLPTKAARKAAVRSMDDAARAVLSSKAAELGVSVEKVTEAFINNTARQTLAARSFKSTLGSHALSYAGEVASEPASEYVASKSIGDVTAEDLIYETMGGIGAGPIGAAINTAAFGTKLAKDKTKAFTEKIITSTPESRETLKQLKTETKADKARSDARNQYDFKKDVAEVEVDDPRIAEWSDASNKEKYNPAKAVAALSKFTDNKEAVNKAEAVYYEIHKAALEVNDKLTVFTEKGVENLDAQEKQQYAELTKQMNAKVALLNQIKPQIMQMRETRAANKIEVKTATPEEVVARVAETYGSSQASLNINQLDTLLSRNDLPDAQRSLIQAIKEAEEIRQTIETSRPARSSSKTLAQVRDDVYSGTKEYKGIDAFKTAIANFLHPSVNKQDLALAELESLKKFRDSHQKKQQKLTEAFEKIKQASFDPQTESRPEIKVYAGGTAYNIHRNSGRLIEAVNNEAIALQKEVVAAEKLIAAKSANPSAKVETGALPTASKKEILEALVTEGKATKRAGGYFVHPDAAWDSNNMAGTLQDGTVYVHTGISAKFLSGDAKVTEDLNNRKAPMFEAMGIDVNQFRTLFSSRKELNAFLFHHEQSHKKNNDKAKYPRKADGTYDITFKEAVAIELRATMDALTDEQKKKLSALVESNKKAVDTDPVTTEQENEEISDKTSQETEGKKESTPVNNADSVSPDIDTDTALEEADPTAMQLTYTDINGEQVTKSYNEAMVDISTQLKDTVKILRCLGVKR